MKKMVAAMQNTLIKEKKMNAKLIAIIAFLSTGYLYAEDFVMIKAPCNQKNAQGECIAWGVMNKGCKAPMGGTCKVDFSHGDKRAVCDAVDGGSCNSSIRLQ